MKYAVLDVPAAAAAATQTPLLGPLDGVEGRRHRGRAETLVDDDDDDLVRADLAPVPPYIGSAPGPTDGPPGTAPRPTAAPAAAAVVDAPVALSMPALLLNSRRKPAPAPHLYATTSEAATRRSHSSEHGGATSTAGRRKLRRSDNARLASNPHAVRPSARDFAVPLPNPLRRIQPLPAALEPWPTNKSHSTPHGATRLDAPDATPRRASGGWSGTGISGAGRRAGLNAPASLSGPPTPLDVEREYARKEAHDALQGQFRLAAREARAFLKQRMGVRCLPALESRVASVVGRGGGGVGVGVVEGDGDGDGGESGPRRADSLAPSARFIAAADAELCAWLSQDLYLTSDLGASSVAPRWIVPPASLSASASASPPSSSSSDGGREQGEGDDDFFAVAAASEASPATQHAGRVGAGSGAGVAPLSDAEHAYTLLERRRAPHSLCWEAEDPFVRLGIHCLARLRGCPSFSKDEAVVPPLARRSHGGGGGNGDGGAGGATDDEEQSRPGDSATDSPKDDALGADSRARVVRATWILHPRPQARPRTARLDALGGGGETGRAVRRATRGPVGGATTARSTLRGVALPPETPPTTDVGTDVGTDAGTDVATDAGTEAGTDVGEDEADDVDDADADPDATASFTVARRAQPRPSAPSTTTVPARVWRPSEAVDEGSEDSGRGEAREGGARQDPEPEGREGRTCAPPYHVDGGDDDADAGARRKLARPPLPPPSSRRARRDGRDHQDDEDHVEGDEYAAEFEGDAELSDSASEASVASDE